jgi:hypothetical protein
MRETRPRVAYSGEGCGSSAETLTTDYAGCARNANPCCGLGYGRVGAGAVGETPSGQEGSSRAADSTTEARSTPECSI